MFLSWKNADLVMDLMWESKERDGSKRTPRFRTREEGQMEQPSMERMRSLIFWRVSLGAITMSSVLLVLSFKKLMVIQFLISWRQASTNKA